MKNRTNKILELLTQKNKIEVSQLSEKLGVSQVTVRKDLDELENKGYVYVIRHKGDMRVTRTTTNYHLLKELYDECRMEGEKLIRDMELISQISFAAIFRYLQEFS